METKEKFINLEEIRDLITLSDVRLFPFYLKEIYKDLVDRAESNKTKGISRVTFFEYIKLPIFLSEKLFNALDKDIDDHLNMNEFVHGLNQLYYGSLRETSKVIFNMYDFDRDGYVLKDDVKTILSYLPLINEEMQVEALQDIDILVNSIKFDKISFDAFMTLMLKTTSDLFIQLVCFLYESKPFSIENIEACRNHPKYLHLLNNPSELVNTDLLNSPELKNKKTKEIGEGEKMLSPSKTPFNTYINHPNINMENFELLPCDEEDEKVDIKLPVNSKKEHSKMKPNEIISNEVIRLRNNNTKADVTPTKYLLKNKKKDTELDMDGFSLDSPENGTKVVPPRKKQSSKKIEPPLVINKGYIYKVTENGNVKKYFLSLVNKDIYYYKTEKCDVLEGMRNLSGSYIAESEVKRKQSSKGFLKDGKEMNIKETGDTRASIIRFENRNLYPFSIVFSHKTRTYYCDSQEEVSNWIEKIKEGIGYQCLTDLYEFKDTLGEGKFGLVKLGIHKKTKQKVAIKIIKKAEMTLKDMELVKSEIDIMKKCRHPNIVRLLDHFESRDFTFIVMEYLAGNTFAHYLETTPIDALTEKDCCKIVYQVALALQYLHSFGIVHRDLKPENIMIKDKLPYDTMESCKLMDFGLSKILGPNEKVNDGFGTLTYVAPEVLTRKPYNKSVDVWSMGVIVFYTLSGTFPFDDSSNNEEIIAKKTVFQELKFTHKSWSSRSPAVKDFILKTMTKDIDSRIKIDEAVQHPWFVECGLTQNLSFKKPVKELSLSPRKYLVSNKSPEKPIKSVLKKGSQNL